MPEGLQIPQPNAMGLGSMTADPSYQAGVKRLGDLGTERQKATQVFEKEAGGVQQRIGAERDAGAALKEPTLANVQDKFEHKGLRGEEMNEAMQTMFALAAIGGLMTRAPMTAAMNAWSASMKGFMQGDKALFDRESGEFDRNLKVAIAKNTQAREEYKAAFDKHRGNMQDLMNEWNIINKKYGDTTGAINMERQDIQGMLRHMESMAKMDDNARKWQATLTSQNDRFRQTLEERDRYHQEMVAARATDAKIRQQVAASKGANKPMTAMQSTMYEDVATGFSRLDILRDMEKETGELPGGSMYLQSQMHNGGIVSAIRGYGVNATLPEGYQQTDALLLGIAFDIASARSGGRGQLSDSKIREVTRQMPLGSDAPDTRALKYKLIENQLEVANHTLPPQFQYDLKTKKQAGAAAAPTAAGAPPPPPPGFEVLP